MKYAFTAAALFAATVSADLCADGSTDSNGNWYCQEVTAITYTGVGGAGSYSQITNMDSNTGLCTSNPFGYSGNLAPFDEEVSMHFRGPMEVKQFAAYVPGSSSSKARRSAHHRRHAHAHAHHQHHARDPSPVEERQLGAEVTATIDGAVVSWANNWSGESTTAAASSAQATSSAAAPVEDLAVQGSASAAASSNSGSSSTSSGSSSSDSAVPSGSWGRQAYYDASSGTADGLVFLNHEGGSGSGTFDYKFGNSLSYASSDGTAGSSSPQVLADTTISSSTEVVIMTDNECENDDCGYVRPGTVAYHGFDGASKAFLMEFSMPSDGQTSASQYDAVNMPAIWMLNAQIPRTLQYGSATCSCWTTGCGEFDIFEVLAPGDARAKSTIHGNIAGGDSDYFARPFDSTIQVGVVLYDNNFHIKVLNGSVPFGSSVSQDIINEIVQATSTQTNTISLFSLSG